MTLHPRKLLVLDIDGTLVFAEDKSQVTHMEIEQNHHFELEEGSILVWKRPDIDEFLEWCLEQYDVGVWSASGSEYVHAVVDHIFPEHLRSKLKFIWTSSRCTRRYHQRSLDVYGVPFTIKKLRKLWRRKTNSYNRRNTLILDDSPSTYRENYGNAIPIASYAASSKDRELQRIKSLLETLILSNDVRTIHKLPE
ncbi:unnamed protein product [Adineta ricciae]|uniref:Mitochondrial import inner membrane translocase subunit TIM50 n=1 Tax=Adineta ricciae TaxID=249248 RepID=A0A815CAE8_ADIRI|nr:unnamed protein product [Adineta ricciae]CAF1432468.1 unnamed protein product [Adineta ricciae]